MGCGGSTQNQEKDVDGKNNKEKYEYDEKDKQASQNDKADRTTLTDEQKQRDLDTTPTPETGGEESNKAQATDTEPETGGKAVESPAPNGVSDGGTPTQSPSADAERGEGSRGGSQSSSMYSMVQSQTSAADVGADGEEDPDEMVMRSIQKIREQAMADARKYGFSEVKVKGVSIRSIGGPVELSPKDLQRIRRWTDFIPPFEPIPPAAEPTENGRHPRENTLRVNQELLDSWERDQKAAARIQSSPRPPSQSQKNLRPKSPADKPSNHLGGDLNKTGPVSHVTNNEDPNEVLSPGGLDRTQDLEAPNGEKQGS